MTHYVVQSGSYFDRGVDVVFDTFDEAVEHAVSQGWGHYYDDWSSDIQEWSGTSSTGMDIPPDHPLVSGALGALATEREKRQRERAERERARRQKEQEEKESRMQTPRLFLTCEVQTDGTVEREAEKEIRVGDSPLDDAVSSSWFLPGGSVVVQAHGTDFDRTRKAYQDRVAETKARALGLTGE